MGRGHIGSFNYLSDIAICLRDACLVKEVSEEAACLATHRLIAGYLLTARTSADYHEGARVREATRTKVLIVH